MIHKIILVLTLGLTTSIVISAQESDNQENINQLTRQEQRRLFILELPNNEREAIITLERVTQEQDAALNAFFSTSKEMLTLQQPMPAEVLIQFETIERNLLRTEEQYIRAERRLSILCNQHGINLQTLTMTNPTGN
jgi:hypothetical protein